MSGSNFVKFDERINDDKAQHIYRRMEESGPAEYARHRKAWAEELDIGVGFLDAEYKQRQKNKQWRAAKPSYKKSPDTANLKLSAAALIESRNVLAAFTAELEKVVAGEKLNAKLLYLVCTSRLLDKTMHAVIKGTSAGGKSELRKKVLDFFPPESIVSFTSLSEKALIYHDGDFAHKILSMGEAVATDEQNFQDYLLRELMSEGRICHHTVQKVGNDISSIVIEKKGPVSFLVTTTKNKLHPENETRMLSLEIDDTEKQTQAVLGKVADMEGLNPSKELINFGPWKDFQRWLEIGERRVIIPFAVVLADAIPPASVRLRRDFGQVLRAIKSHALLHRQHRDRDDMGRIVADIEHDYAAVRTLMNALLAESSGLAVNPHMQATIDAVVETTASMSDDEGATAQSIAEALKLDKSAAWRRLRAAQSEGYITNLETRRGQPGCYRATGQKIEVAELLPEAETLAARPLPLSSRVSKSAQPCNSSEFPEEKQPDNGCKPHCNPPATACNPESGCNPTATGYATTKSLGNNGIPPAVARLHGKSSPRGEGDTSAIDACEERAAVPEYDAGLSRVDAERQAAIERNAQLADPNLDFPELPHFLRRSQK